MLCSGALVVGNKRHTGDAAFNEDLGFSVEDLGGTFYFFLSEHNENGELLAMFSKRYVLLRVLHFFV